MKLLNRHDRDQVMFFASIKQENPCDAPQVVTLQLERAAVDIILSVAKKAGPVEAIKMVRHFYKLGLWEAKEVVHQLMALHCIPVMP